MFYSIVFWTSTNLRLTVHLLIWKMIVVIHRVYPIQNDYFMKQYHKKIWLSMFEKKVFRIHFLFHLLKFHLKLPQLLTKVDKYLPHHQISRRVLPKNSGHNLVFLTKKNCGFGMKQRTLKGKQYLSFWSSAKFCKGFPNE